MDIRPGSKLDGPDGQQITIESLVGSGGFGQVLCGRLPDGTRVAVKTVLTAALADSELRTLQNEAQLASEIDHPNVVRVLLVNDGAVGEDPPYLVMEYIDGGPLRDVLYDRQARGELFDPDELRAMYLQIAAGMEAVNTKLVHRDLKPENVLVDSATGRLKIADFGLAKLADAVTRSASFKGWGTMPYMAPEAFDNRPNTTAMDMYSAGVLFHELAALQLPVVPVGADRGPMAWRRAHYLQPPVDLRAVRSDLPYDLLQLVMEMLQKDPAKRPRSWRIVTERLTRGGVSLAEQPDVGVLVERATTRYREESEAEIRAQAERERIEERTAILQQVFREPIQLLRSLVGAFNNASAIRRLTIRDTGALSVEVKGTTSQSVVLDGGIIDDLNVRGYGIVRLIATVQVRPGPTFREVVARGYDPESFSGFNLVYRVQASEDQYGTWDQFRFKLSPLLPMRYAIGWIAMDFDELPRQLQALHAIGEYEHEQRGLDDMWFRALLLQIV